MRNQILAMGTVLALTFGAAIVVQARETAGAGGAVAGGLASGSGGQSDLNINAQGRANTNGPNAADRDWGRDRAEDRRSQSAQNHKLAPKSRMPAPSKSTANTNGPSSSDRDFGTDRAEDRKP